MSVKVTSWVWEHSRSRGAQRLVLLCIADHANDDGLEAFPSLARLARKTGMTERGVQKAIQALVALGELQVTMGGGRGRSNRYRVLMQTPNDVPPLDANPEPETANPIPRTTFTESGSTNTAAGNPEPSSYEPSLNRPKNSSSKSSSGTRGTRLPDNFGITREMRAWAAEEIPGFGIDREHMRFRDHWRGAAGARGVKLDWIATWRNWMRRAADQVRPNVSRQPHQPYTNPTDPNAYREGL